LVDVTVAVAVGRVGVLVGRAVFVAVDVEVSVPGGVVGTVRVAVRSGVSVGAFDGVRVAVDGVDGVGLMLGVVVGAITQPDSALLTPPINSFSATVPSPFTSNAAQTLSGASPSAICTPRISSLTATTPLRSQSPTHGSNTGAPCAVAPAGRSNANVSNTAATRATARLPERVRPALTYPRLRGVHPCPRITVRCLPFCRCTEGALCCKRQHAKAQLVALRCREHRHRTTMPIETISRNRSGDVVGARVFGTYDGPPDTRPATRAARRAPPSGAHPPRAPAPNAPPHRVLRPPPPAARRSPT